MAVKWRSRIRPTGVLDPVVEAAHRPGGRSARIRGGGQEPAGAGHHPHQGAEDLTDYLAENEVRVRYLHRRSIDRADRDHQDLRQRIRRASGGEPAAGGSGPAGGEPGGDP